MFWLCLANGAAGHTYGANGIWQCNRPGQPHGPSPTAGSPPTGYGAIPWNEAMHLPGSTQVGLGKKLFERYPWPKFEPHPEWATFAPRSLLSLDGCHWIWFPQADAAHDAPAAKRFFRRRFTLPQDKPIASARLRVSADDRFTAHLNGRRLGGSIDEAESWRAGRQFDDLTALFHPGENVLAIEAENLPSPGANPAGLIARLEVRFAAGDSLVVDSDASWRCADSAGANWPAPDFDDAGWFPARPVARYGDAPWGALTPPDRTGPFAPQSTGLPDGVRITYVPDPDPITLHDLAPRGAYAATCFDPVTGATTPLAPIRANDRGAALASPPGGCDHDWVLILEPSTAAATEASKPTR
jgi:hypothetical protein